MVRWEFGDFFRDKLREGNTYTSTDALDFILPYLNWPNTFARRVWFRMDENFPSEPFQCYPYS